MELPLTKYVQRFLYALNERIIDHYGSRAYFDEYYQILIDFTADPSAKQQLMKQKEAVYDSFLLKSDVEEDFLPSLADSLGSSIDATSHEYQQRKKSVEAKFEFATWAADGKYFQAITIPGQVISHNADSVNGSVFFWKPSYLKFLLQDYTFFVETRESNT
jgi:hypothetical protein